MKALLVLLVFTLLAFGAQAAKITESIYARERSISSQVVDILEAIKPQMVCGWPELGIPPLAPLVIPSRSINVNTSNFTLNGQVNNFTLNGLNEYEVINFKLNIPLSRINFEIIFPNLNYTTDYQVNLGNGARFARTGGAFFALKDLSIRGNIRYSLGVISKYVRIKQLKIYVTVGSVVSNIENLSNNKIINRKLNEIVQEWFLITINEGSDYAADYIDEIAVPVINELIGDRTLRDIISIITGGGNGGRESDCTAVFN